MTSEPLRFAFAVHLHQPVGNFDHVFEEHVAEVYRPFLEAVFERGALPITVHVSGPLLDWLEAHDGPFLDLLGERVAAGDVELLGSGRYEQILAVLPRADRVAQVEGMTAKLEARFGVTPRGLWLTERVWEQELATDLARAGIRYALLDDRHFMAAGLPRDSLDRPYATESGGERLGLLSIDERLRYLIPFRPVEEIEAFLRAPRPGGLVVLGDDGEKFGGWPGTREWVYEGGWLHRFLDLLERLTDEGVLRLVSAEDAFGRSHRHGGLVYPAPGSYREMEEWTLPRPAARRFHRLSSEHEDDPLVRGGHWRSFFTRYEESSRMHSAALRLRRLCRARGDPPEARDAVARATCNDAYWHGVFGGIYLPHLRNAVWRSLARAERALRASDRLEVETLDWDLDGADELWVHSPAFSAVLAPARGGAIVSLLRLESGENDVDVLTRRLEAYHGEPGAGSDAGTSWEEIKAEYGAVDGRVQGGDGGDAPSGGTPSIHEMHRRLRPIPPALDPRTLALFQDRVIVATGDPARRDLADSAYRVESVAAEDDVARIRLEAGPPRAPIGKTFELRADGRVRVTLDWSRAGLPSGAGFATSLALAWPRTVRTDPAAEERREPILTVARSERGFEEVVQGTRLELRWPADRGSAEVWLAP